MIRTAELLLFVFGTDDRRVESREEADIKMDEVTYDLLYRVEFWTRQSTNPFKRIAIVKEDFATHAVRPDTVAPTTIGWMSGNKAIPTCPGLEARTAVTPISGPRPSTSARPVSRVSSLDRRPVPSSPLLLGITREDSMTQPSTRNEHAELRARAAEIRSQKSSTNAQPLFRPSTHDFSSPPPAQVAASS